MNKAELIAQIADEAGITKTQANTALDSFVGAVTKTLKKGDKVTLVGFGTFSVTKRAARNGRNPLRVRILVRRRGIDDQQIELAHRNIDEAFEAVRR